MCFYVNENVPAKELNRRLTQLAKETPCHCQRRSQCSTGIQGETERRRDNETERDIEVERYRDTISSGTMSEGFNGFVVSVAIVKNLQMQIHSPSEA